MILSVKQVYTDLLSKGVTRRKTHTILIIIILFLFFIFFTSRFWLPAAGTLVETPIGTVHESGYNTFVLKSWKQNQQTGHMLVTIGITDMSVGVDVSYNLGAYDLTNSQVDFEVVYAGSDFMMIKIPSAKRYAGLTIAIQVVEEKNGEILDKNSTVFTYSALTENVQDDSTLQENPGEKECILMNLQSDAELMEVRLQECDSAISENQTVVDSATKKIADMEQGLALQTPAEQDGTKQQISALYSSIDTAKREIEKLESDRYDIVDQIDAKLAIVQDYKATNKMG